MGLENNFKVDFFLSSNPCRLGEIALGNYET